MYNYSYNNQNFGGDGTTTIYTAGKRAKFAGALPASTMDTYAAGIIDGSITSYPDPTLAEIHAGTYSLPVTSWPK